MSSPLDFEIPGYDIIESIGRGGMASVYRARQHTFDRNVALKILKPDLSEDDAFCQRFIMESMIVAKLSHSHIVQVYDVGEISNHYYIAMEFLSGGDLSGRLKQGISPKEAIHVIKQIASALDFAHRKNIIHRDLKPDNVMFREDEAAVLTDFGIAKETTADINLTQTGLIVGTPKYMSPEQIRGAAPSPEGDIYSLGIMFFQLLCNRVPFQGPDLVATAYKHFNDPVPQLPAHLAPFQSLIEQMLAKDAEDRIPRGNDVIAEIEDIERRHPLFENPEADETALMSLDGSDEDATVVKINSEETAEKLPTKHSQQTANQKTTIVAEAPASAPLASSAETIVMNTNDETQVKPRTHSKESQNHETVVNQKPTAESNTSEKKPLENNKPGTNDNNSEEKSPPPNNKHKNIMGAAASIVIVGTIGFGILSGLPDQNKTAPIAEGNNDSTTNIDEKQTSHQKKIEQLLSSAEIAYKTSPLATHNDSALALYKKVLALSPNDPRALNTLDDIANAHLAEAQKSLTKLDIQQAKKHLDAAKEAKPEVNTLELENKILANSKKPKTLTAKQSFQISALLEEAKYYEEEGAIDTPPGGNALETYNKILAIDPNNATAKLRIDSITK